MPEERPLVDGVPDPAIEEAPAGDSAAGKRVSEALRALTRAARSFLLYEPNNATVRQFLEVLRMAVRGVLTDLGALDLEVRPFELLWRGEVVYHETDRERSLAFRLFRDGVRRLAIGSEASWEEVLRLLEVLSVRYTRVRQNEDDVVTLLRKADLTHVEFEVVEGFVPEDEDAPAEQPAGARPSGRDEEASLAISPRWDLPQRELPDLEVLEWREIDAADRGALVQEEGADAFPSNSVRAVRALLDLRSDEREGDAEDIVRFIAEVRDFLLGEGELSAMLALVRTLYDSMALARERAGPALRGFSDPVVLRRIVLTASGEATTLPAEAAELFDLLPIDHLGALIDLLEEDFPPQTRRVLRQVLERYIPTRPDYVLSRLRGAQARAACDLLRACARAIPDRAVDAAVELAGHSDPEVLDEALRRFEDAPANPRVGRTLAQLLRSPRREVRRRALELLAQRSERAAFAAVSEHVAGAATDLIEEEEVTLLGRTLARLSPESALQLFDDWLRSKGRIRRWGEGSAAERLARVAVSGLQLIPGEPATALLRDVSETGDGVVAQRADAALARRLSGEAGHG